MGGSALDPSKEDKGLENVVDKILDKGLVINSDIVISLTDVELLGIKARVALASFDTAAKYGLEFPTGTERNIQAWKDAKVGKDVCPQCEKTVPTEELLNKSCPWCGWVSAKAKAKIKEQVKV